MCHGKYFILLIFASCCCNLGTFAELQNSNSVSLTVGLIFVNDTDGKLFDGHPCSCDMRIVLCLDELHSSTSPISCFTQPYYLDQLQINASSYTFSNNVVYGNWANPQTVHLSSQSSQGFLFKWNIYDSDEYYLIDQFTLPVTVIDSSVIDYSHPRLYGVKPFEIRFFWYFNTLTTTTTMPTTTTTMPTTTTTLPTTTIFNCQHGGTPASTNDGCLCPPTYNGTSCEQFVPRNCFDIFIDTESGSLSPGIYTIYLNDDNNEQVILQVYCNNGWTKVQQRYSYSDFQQSWTSYENGFGSLDNSGDFNYWMGNKYFHYLTINLDMAARFSFKFCNGTSLVSVIYSTILIGSSETNYTFTASGYSSTTGLADGTTWFNGSPFSVSESDGETGNCAFEYDKSGFWFNPQYCPYSAFNLPNLNGVFPDITNCANQQPNSGILWTPLTGSSPPFSSLTFSEIEIAPSSSVPMLLAIEELQKSVNL